MLLLRSELHALGNIMPFCQTAPTTGRGGMLGDKYRVTAHGRLFTVVGRLRRCKAFFDKIRGMLVNGFGAFVPAVLPFLIA
jgi:hypothetical protein